MKSLKVQQFVRNHIRLVEAIVVALVVVVIGAVIYIVGHPRQSQQVAVNTNHYVLLQEALKSGKTPPKTQTPQEYAQQQYSAAQKQLAGKTSYNRSDLGALYQLVLAAQVLGKKDEAKSAAKAALVVINGDPSLQKEFPTIKPIMEQAAQ